MSLDLPDTIRRTVPAADMSARPRHATSGDACGRGWGGRCAASKGARCTCRCGGRNHGRHHGGRLQQLMLPFDLVPAPRPVPAAIVRAAIAQAADHA
ncbi:MAG: hypothetical protein H3C62_10775 [Gemmatimonadaceae bacterium]|nr:hypothetical protein [Gemmatimonadaceae bacterium]